MANNIINCGSCLQFKLDVEDHPRLMINNTEDDYYNINAYFQNKAIDLDVKIIVDALNNVVLIRNRKMKYLRQQAKILKKCLVHDNMEINLSICQHIIAIHHRYKDWRHALAALPEI